MATYSTLARTTARPTITLSVKTGVKQNFSSGDSGTNSGLGALYPRYDGAGARGEQSMKATITQPGNYQIPNVNCDVIIIVKKTVGEATTVFGRSVTSTDYNDTIVDGKGDAATNNITFVPGTGLVNDAASVVLNTARASVKLGFNGTDYYKLAD